VVMSELPAAATKVGYPARHWVLCVPIECNAFQQLTAPSPGRCFYTAKTLSRHLVCY